MRQKPESYNQDKDSPLIGGYDEREKVQHMFFPKEEYKGKLNGAASVMPTASLITLLEQAAEEFPSNEGLPYANYDAEEIEAWKRKWLTVPPV